MLIKLLVFSTLLFLSLSQTNYQERNVYYSQSDNACYNGKDVMRLIINIDDQDRVKYELDTGTSCSSWSFRYASSITVYDPAQWSEYDWKRHITTTQITLPQQITKKNSFGLLSAYIAKTTIKNPVLINQANYNCTIFGDETVQHFGISFDTPPAEIYMRCLSITKQQADKLREEGKNLETEHQ